MGNLFFGKFIIFFIVSSVFFGGSFEFFSEVGSFNFFGSKL